MAISLQVKNKQNYCHIDIGGALTTSSLMELRKAVECGLKASHKVFLFDLKEMVLIDSKGIGFLVNLHKELQKAGGKICLSSLQPKILSVIQSCGLQKIIEIYNSVEEAGLTLGSGISSEKHGFYALLKIPGELDLNSIKQLRKEIEDITGTGYTHIVVDLKETVFISSVGIGILINLHRNLKEKDGCLYLLGVTPQLRSVLEDTNVLEILPEYKTLQEIEDNFI